jgi:hypothetical protein
MEKYLGKIIEYTKTVKKKKYVYVNIHIENKTELAKEFKVGEYVKVSIEKLEGIV